MSIEPLTDETVTQADLQRAREICQAIFQVETTDPHTMVAGILARHRQQAERDTTAGGGEGAMRDAMLAHAASLEAMAKANPFCSSMQTYAAKKLRKFAALATPAPGVGLAEGFEAEHDVDTFTIRFPDGHALTAWADGRLVITKHPKRDFTPFEVNVASLSTLPDTGGGK